MKILNSFFALTLLAFCVFPAVAQNDPPPSSPVYFPENWKESTYENDKFKVKFPKEPVITVKADDVNKATTRSYSHQSFIEMKIEVTEYSVNFEDVIPIKDILLKMRDAGLDAVKNLDPKIIKESDITQDGKLGKFIHLEANNGEVLRAKFFVVKNRLYFIYASVKKGDKHGFNYENDFEKVAMGFLDSFKLI